MDVSQGWKSIDRISHIVGRKHFRPATLPDFLALRVVVPAAAPPSSETVQESETIVKPGDRVVFSMENQQIDALRRPPHLALGDTSTINGFLNHSPFPKNALDEHVAFLRKTGVVVEIRETK